jgi:hypothetical protein
LARPAKEMRGRAQMRADINANCRWSRADGMADKGKVETPSNDVQSGTKQPLAENQVSLIF